MLDRINSFPENPTDLYINNYKNELKKHLKTIVQIQFKHDITFNPRLNLQKFYGKNAKFLKTAFNLFANHIRKNYEYNIYNLNLLENEISKFLRELNFDIIQFLLIVMNNKYNIIA